MVSACLISYKRPQNIPKIVDHLMSHGFISEVMIRDNSKGQNLINYGRYRLGEKAENEWFYTQDDDCINHDLPKLYEAWSNRIDDEDGIYHSGTQSYIDQQEDMIFGDKQACMVGWGAFLKKEWMIELKRYTDVYGYDELYYRETDRILSVLLNRHHNSILCDIEHLEGYNDEEIAMCKQPGHKNSRDVAIQRALTL